MEERHPNLPDAPTFHEVGIDMVDGAYRGIAVPKATPEVMRQQISNLFAKLNQDSDFIARKQALGFVPLDIPYADVPAFLKKRIKKYRDLARDAGLIE
jgi:tripartite-type tricarboxylate transporter receptor subunit TctC